MQPISSLSYGTAQSTASVSGVRDVPKVQRPESEEQSRSSKPVMDEYVPEKQQEPSGRYWLGKDEDGQPKVYFDDPEQGKGAGGTGKKANNSEKAETCTGNTDQVDREIEKLKKKQAELERQISSETDDTKIKELEKKLAQVKNELRQKDNDAYRRQHATFS